MTGASGAGRSRHPAIAGVAAALGGMLAPGCRDTGDGGVAQKAARVEVVFGEVGTSPGQFTYPRAIDSDGRDLWVIDKSARVQRIDPRTGRGTALWRMPRWDNGKPVGVTAGPPLPGIGSDPFFLYVADTHYHRIMVYRPAAKAGGEPELVTEFGTFGEGPGQFIYVTDVAVLVTADGARVERLYVSEYGGNDRISVFDGGLKFMFQIGGKKEGAPALEGTDGEGLFNRPESIAIDPDRKLLVVTDACNHRVGVFTLEGALVRWIGSPERAGQGPGEFSYPYGVAQLGDGTVMVSEFGNHRVQHLDLLTGETLGLYGRPGRGKGEFTNPWALTVQGDTVYVLDSGNERVQGLRRPDRVR